MAKKKQDAAPTRSAKKSLLKQILQAACVYYTVTTFILIFLFWLISDDITRAMHPLALMLILPFSVCFAAANTVFKSEKLSGLVSVLLHYALTMGGVWLFLFLPNKSTGQTASGALILFLVLSLIYAIIMGVVLYMRGRIKRITREESNYTSVYKS